jgi:hypothetical protein
MTDGMRLAMGRARGCALGTRNLSAVGSGEPPQIPLCLRCMARAMAMPSFAAWVRTTFFERSIRFAISAALNPDVAKARSVSSSGDHVSPAPPALDQMSGACGSSPCMGLSLSSADFAKRSSIHLSVLAPCQECAWRRSSRSFIFTRRFDVVVSVTSRVQSQPLAPTTKSEASPLSGADRATALYSVDPLRIVP